MALRARARPCCRNATCTGVSHGRKPRDPAAVRVLAGEVITPDHPEYDSARRVWNGMIDKRPAFIVRCAGVDDVAAAIRFAGETGLPLAVRGGGHNVAGTSVVDDGVVVDLSPMRAVRVDVTRGTVHVQGGATWADVDRVTAPLGLATPGGVVSETGVAGLALSGGVSSPAAPGRDDRRQPRLRPVVLADGRYVRAAADEHPDLFWALRGGGGNFGVVTSFELELHRLGPEVFSLNVAYPVEDAAAVLAAWRDAVAGAPDEINSAWFMWTFPVVPELPEQLRGRRYVGIDGMYAGDPDEGERLMRGLRELDAADRRERPDVVPRQAGPARPVLPGRAAVLLEGALPRRAVRRRGRRHGVVERGPPSDRTLIVIRHCGGAISRVEPEATAFGDRSSEWMLSIDATWDDPAEDERNIAWTRAYWDDMHRFSSGKTYFNFPGLLEEGEAVSSARTTHRIKRQYDPAL